MLGFPSGCPSMVHYDDRRTIMKILFAETAIFVRKGLEAEGYSVGHVESGKDALLRATMQTAREFLEAFYDRIATEFDLSKNQLKNGVKSGECKINGTRYVDVYISNKTATGKNLSPTWLQEDVESKPCLHLLLRHVGAGGTGELQIRYSKMKERQLRPIVGNWCTY